jgi:MFS family permease
MLTSWLSWRWTLFVNAPIGAALIVATPRFIRESERNPGRFDVAGALTSTLGMTALVYGFIRAADEGWSDDITMMSFAIAVVLLATFVLIELRSRQPITPLHLFANRNRSGSYAVMLIFAAAMFGMFFFLTLFVQNVLGYSPLRAGFSFVPVTVAIAITAGIASKTVLTVGPRRLMIIGGVLAAVGLTWLAQIQESSSYLGGLLIPMLLFGLGMGFIFVPVTIVALTGVQPHESGAGSSLLNVMQMVGGSLGLSILVTVFGTASRNEFEKQFPQFVAATHPTDEQLAHIQQSGQLPNPWGSHILAHGISSAFQVAAVLAVLALIVTIVTIRAKASDLNTAAVPGMGGG